MTTFITSAFLILNANAAVFTTWTCWAQGQMRMGPPGAPMMETVYGHGPTQQDAQMDALNQCLARGLQMCQIQSCMQP